MLSAFALAIRNLRAKSRSEPSALYGKGVAGLQQQDFSVHLGSPNPLPPFMPAQVRGHLDKRNRQGTADEIAEGAIRSPRGRSGNSRRRDRSRSARKIAISGLLAPYSTSFSDGRPPGRAHEKSGPGLSSTPSSTSSGAADADSISPSLSFFTLPTALSTFHAVIFSDSKAAGGLLPMGSLRGQECCASLRFVMRSSCVAACPVSTNNLVPRAILY